MVLFDFVSMKQVWVYSMGYKVDKFFGDKGEIIMEVFVGIGVEEVGLQVGDKVIGYNFYKNLNVEGELLIVCGDKEEWVKFYLYCLVIVFQF